MPTLLLPVDEERARQELHFVVEGLENQRTGQESCIHENAFAKWGVIRHGLGLFKSQDLAGKIRGQNLTFEDHSGIGDAYRGLIYQEGGLMKRIRRKSHAPRSSNSAPVLDYCEEDNIHYHGDCERHNDMAQQAVRFHSASHLKRRRRMSRPAQLCVDVTAEPDLTRIMRIVVSLAVLLLVMSCAGCLFGRKHAKQPAPAATRISHPATNAPATADTFTVTPEEGLHGRISSVNSGLRFVVLTFPIGQMPPLDEHLNVYRNGFKVAELKITGPQRDDNTVADIVSGDPITGDEVREK